MKQKIKRHSRSVMSVVLALCMLVSCMTVGLIATDAAKLTGEKVGTTYYIWKASGNSGNTGSTYTCIGASPQSFSAASGTNYYIAVSDSSTNISSNTVWLDGADFTGVTVSSQGTQGFDGKQAYRFSLSSADTVSVAYSSGSKIQVTGTGSTNDVYLCGYLNGTDINSGNASYKFTQDPSDSSIYTLTWTPTTADQYIQVYSGSTLYKVSKYNGLTSDTWCDMGTTGDEKIGIKGVKDTEIVITWDNTNHKVKWGYPETKYNVAISAGTGGTISPSGTQSVGITTGLPVTATPSDGYSFSSWTKTNVTTTTETASTTVKPTDSNVTHALVANFTKNNYKVTYGSASHGTFTVKNGSTSVASGGSVPYDTELTVDCSPAKGYVLSSVTYTDANGDVTDATGSGNTRTFNVPAANTTIVVTFAGQENAISTSITPEGYGNIWVASSSSSSTALTNYKTGDTVYLRATANEGYEFTKFVVTYADNTTEEITTNNSSLTIDTTHFSGNNGAITVVGHFAKKDLTVTKGTESHGTFTVSTETSQIGNTVTISDITPANGYRIGSVTYNDGTSHNATADGDNYIFTMPGKNVTVNVTFTTVTYTVTAVASPAAGGSLYVKNAASVGTDSSFNYNIESTGSLYFKAKANAAYMLSSVTVKFSDGTADAVYTVDNETPADAVEDNVEKETGISLTGHYGNISVTAAFTKKPTHTITVKSSNAAYGTALASVSEAYEGQSVTLTASEASGTFKKWAVESGTVSGVADEDDASIEFTMGETDLVIKAIFEEYSEPSKYYYNNYGSDGQPSATSYSTQMTETKLNGETYSYLKVSGRSESDQLFTVSIGCMDRSLTAKYFYFQGPTNWTDWDANEDQQYVAFWASDGNRIQDYRLMDRCSSLDITNFKGYQISIPNGARYAVVKSGYKNKYTKQIDLNTNTNGGNNGFKLGTWDSSSYNVVGFYNEDYTGVTGDIYEYFYNSSDPNYLNSFSTCAMTNHNANRDASHSYAKPNNSTVSSSDYYVLVLYKDKTYTINNVEHKVTKDPEIIIVPSLPSAVPENVETVDIYAKNGTLRDSTFNRFTKLANTDFVDYFEYSEVLDSGVYTYTSISDYNDAHSKDITITNDVTGYNSTYATMTNVPIGAKIKLRTTLKSTVETDDGSFNNTAFKNTHYLKAYSFNGMSYQVNTWNSTGVYEEIWTVRDVNTKSADGTTNLTKNGNTIEVTPIYYMKDNSNCKTFYIDGYDGTVQDAWGNMLCVYPYYENKSNKENAFGGYPGQPMLFWGGKYQMEIPLTVDGTSSSATVKGLTLHNAYWDLLHRSLDIRCNARNHAQTYDYDDFYKLYKEKNPDTIIFDFKYRDTYDNFAATGEKEAAHKTYDSEDDYKVFDFAGTANSEPAKGATDFSGEGKNGVELVTDYFGRQVDAFGTLIADAKKSTYDTTPTQTKELLFVSTGFRWTYVGEYATLWAVYAPSEGYTKGSDTANQFIGYISSSMLYLNNIDRRLQYTDGDNTDEGRMSWANFISTYNHLKTYYTGVPALISYEREIWNNSKDKANRSDGKWYYSNKSDQVSANIIIQYNADAGESADIVASKDKALADELMWTTDTFSDTAGVGGQKNIGTTTDCAAYFTNTSPNLVGKVASGLQFADSTKSFTFRADAGGSYMFVNWVRLSNGKYYEISEKELAESVMSSNDTYIARFVKSSSGSLKISHVVEQTGTYKGTGTPAVTVTVKTGGDVQVFSKTVTDGTPIDISSYIQTKFSAYKINISLSTTPDEDCTLEEIVTGAAEKYGPGAIASNAATVTQFTVDDIIKGDVTTLRYVSHLSKTVFTYNYEITYTYTSRFWGTQSYTQTGTCEDGDFTGSKSDAVLTTDFIINKTPYEKNFRQEINWNYTDEAVYAKDGVTVLAAAMSNPAAGSAVSTNTYKMTAHVYSSNTVNDKVTAEFVLPYYHNDKSLGYTAHVADVYDDPDDPHDENGHSNTTYLYDTGHESVTLETEAYKLFTYDDAIHGGADNVEAKDLSLMEAAPYLMMDGDTEQTKIKYHYMPADSKRYFTGNSFTVGDTIYYLRARPDGSTDDRTNDIVMTDAEVRAGHHCVSFTKRKHNSTLVPGADNHKTTYKYAVATGTEGTLDYKVYFFAYAMNENEEMVDNAGNVIDFATQDPVFNGQYIYYSESKEKDGIIQGTGVKKYFTRWDITNTKGEYIASCYNRRFTYSGYDNYVIRPVYESDTENSYATSLADGYKSTITYLDDSRNQWNNGASGNYNSVTKLSDANYAGDKVFADFAITYAYEGKNLNTVPSTEAEIRTGIVIERLDALDTVGTKTITDSSYYADKYKGDNDWLALENALATGGKLTTAVRTAGGESSKDHTCYNSKIGANYNADGYTQFNSAPAGALEGQTSVIDNFNRLQWFYTFNVTTQATSKSDTVTATMKNYAYRAVSYMIVKKGNTTTAYLTDTPTYFTIYDTATRAHN